MNRDELILFIQEEKKRAEKELSFRVDSERVWRGGTDKSWRQVGCTQTKAQRLETSAIHERIAVRAKRRVELFDAVLNELLNISHELPRR